MELETIENKNEIFQIFKHKIPLKEINKRINKQMIYLNQFHL